MSNRFGSGFPLSALCAAVAIVAAAPAMAQNTTAAINGQVLGADGAPLAGASVTIVHRESGSTTTLTTDSQGRFSARGLRVGGPYTVTAVKGNDREVQNDIYLALAETQSLELRVRGANVLETVVTTGSATGTNKFDSSTMGAGTSIGKQELAAYASISRSLQDYARNDPRVVQTDKGNGEISVAGQNGRFNTVTVDGVKINDTFGLELNGLPMLKQPISIDAIQAVQVNISNYDVTQQGYTGANINAVTKSGTNEFTGSVYYVYRDEKLTGDRYDRTRNVTFRTPGFQEDLKGFTLGGPIIKDKLFFFASYEELKSSRTVPSFGPIGTDSVNVGITQAQIQAAQDLAKSKYSIDIGGLNIPKGVNLIGKDTLLKLDWNVNDNHKVNVRYTKSEETNPIFPNFTATQLALSSDWYSQVKTLETVVGQWFADWTDNFSTELKLSQRDYKSDPKNNSDLPQISLTWTSKDPLGSTSNRTLTFGTEQSRHFNSLHTKTFNGFFAGNLFLDKHEIKAGVDIERNEIFNAFLQNTKGLYVFSSSDPVAQWATGTPSTYTVQQPINGNTLQDGAANWTLSNIGLFLQDTWKVSKQLSVVGGLRLDTLKTDDKPKFNAGASAAVIAGNVGTNLRQTGGFGYDNSYTLDGQKIVQPRLGFNYQFDQADKRKMQLRGGVGLFMGSAASVWLTNPYQNTGVTVANLSCGTTAAPCATAAGGKPVQFSADPNNQPQLSGTPPAANVDFIAPGVKQPTVWKMNLALDKELPWYGIVAGAEWLHTEVDKGLYYQFLNLGPVTSTSPVDGREMYYNAAGRNPLCYSGGNDSSPTNCGRVTKALNNQSYNNVTLLKNTSKGDGDVLTLSLQGPNKAGFGWGVAYSFTRATEVSGLTSSTANSGWLNRAVFNPNEEVAANSATMIRNRISGNVNFSKAFFGKYKTTFGMFYEGRTGHAYSWTFNNDVNGDGVAGNDLLYIPKAQGSGEVLFRLPVSGTAISGLPAAQQAAALSAYQQQTAAQAEAKFWAIVDANPSLRNYKGQVVGRNKAFSPFVNSFDVRLSQEVPGFFGNNKGVLTLDILNFGNLINKRWGRIDEVGFGTGGATRRWINYGGIDPATGKMIYSVNDPSDYTTKQTRGESQWAMQITAKYEF
ncbi:MULTISPECIES: TonB-dependent receptor [Roseateles]|uniref:TonB-dependent receptor n=1 Tax=Pelomonas caseinilytica TaxID=2906763 RepID=A0ABS8XIK5_9BURK|nr:MULTISPECIES: TonB-dependent receptor [unclassified Roseateles]MCE4538393.1 TonB-dependent receptor [Pelomonas sp. P7]HEV6966911.1 TonB-dependent receptor [Roseateles sp.]